MVGKQKNTNELKPKTKLKSKCIISQHKYKNYKGSMGGNVVKQ